MPRLAKGAKWTYGWAVVSPRGRIPVPADAWREYGFRPGGAAAFTRGSHTSGGFAVCTLTRIREARGRTGGAGLPLVGRGWFGDGWVSVPQEVGLKTGDRLLTVRGSRYGLGFIARGPIFRYAQGHPELEPMPWK